MCELEMPMETAGFNEPPGKNSPFRAQSCGSEDVDGQFADVEIQTKMGIEFMTFRKVKSVQHQFV